MKLSLTLAATAAAMIAGAAQAAIIENVYTGTVASGTSDGAFGVTGDLANLPYTAVFEYNDDVGYRQTYSGFMGRYGSDYLQGGTNSFVGTTIQAEPNPIIFSYLEINGMRYYIDGSQYSQEAVYQGLEVDSSSFQIYYTSPFRDGFVDESIGTTTAPAQLGQPLDADGTVRFTNEFLIDYAGVYASGDLSPTHVTVSLVSTAPEPATWLLMFAGIAGIGLTLRRARGVRGHNTELS